MRRKPQEYIRMSRCQALSRRIKGTKDGKDGLKHSQRMGMILTGCVTRGATTGGMRMGWLILKP